MFTTFYFLHPTAIYTALFQWSFGLCSLDCAIHPPDLNCVTRLSCHGITWHGWWLVAAVDSDKRVCWFANVPPNNMKAPSRLCNVCSDKIHNKNEDKFGNVLFAAFSFATAAAGACKTLFFYFHNHTYILALLNA